ncbi:nitric oxide synthase oxygenase, partial [Bacillus subtilis]|uniref:nitric oxide synthase oxygenase n=1 Tax=Bacillus subtilis TaxID=1423 RepID=UPI00338EAEB8
MPTFFSNSLNLIHTPHLPTNHQVPHPLFHHIQTPTNNPKITPTITIFPPQHNPQNQLHISNHPLIPYSVYQTHRQTISHPASCSL